MRKQTEKLKEDVKTHMDRVKKSVDDLGTKILDDLNQTGNKLNATVQKDRKDLTKAKEVLNQKLIGADDLLQTMDASRFFKHAKSMTANLKQTDLPKTNSTYQSVGKFVPQKLTSIGEIRFNDVTPCNEEKLEATVKETYTTNLVQIDCILPDLQDTVWIGSYDGVLYHAQINDKGLEIMSKRNIKVWNMARLTRNKILLSVGEHNLKVLDEITGDVTDSVFNASPFRSLGLHVTKDCKVIIVALAGKRKAMIVFDDKGNREAVHEQDQYQRPIFIFPRKLTSTSNGNIHVVDYNKNDEARVIILGRNCHIINRYSGNSEINKELPFRPFDIVTSPTDRVVVPDIDNHTLHILDNTGQFLALFCTKQEGIMYPYSLAHLDKGHLLIGCAPPKGSKTKDAKLHKMKLSGL